MSSILRNVHRSATRLHDAGLVDDVTIREFDALCLPPVRDYSPEEIKKIRNENEVSGTAAKVHDRVESKGLDLLR